MWMDMEQHTPKPIQKGQNHHQKECDHDILQWERETISRNRCIRCWSKSKSSANEGQHVVPKEWSTWQCNTAASSICEQEPDKCRNLIQQHRKRSHSHIPWPRMFHHYWFAHKLSVLTDYKALVAIFKKDVASLSDRQQRILLPIYQYNISLMYRPGLQLFIVDWLSRHNNETKKDQLCVFTSLH